MFCYSTALFAFLVETGRSPLLRQDKGHQDAEGDQRQPGRQLVTCPWLRTAFCTSAEERQTERRTRRKRSTTQAKCRACVANSAARHLRRPLSSRLGELNAFAYACCSLRLGPYSRAARRAAPLAAAPRELTPGEAVRVFIARRTRGAAMCGDRMSLLAV